MKQYTSYSMNFKTRWSSLSAIFLALSFFLRVVHFTVLSDITVFKTGTIIFSLILPLLLCAVGMVLLRALRLKHPLIYAVLGAMLCLMLLIWNCSGGNVLRIILSIVWYLFSGALLIGTALGFVPWRLPATAAFAVALLFRLLVYDLGNISLSGWVLEGSILCIPAALYCLTRCFSENKPAVK